MNMTIEEKIDNFRALLWHAYQAQKNERVIIDAEIIEKGKEFNSRELEDIICESLVADGSLKQRPTFLRVPRRGEELMLEPTEDNKYVIKSSFGYEFFINKNKLAKRGKPTKNQAIIEPLWSLPPGTKWENITIKFQDLENVEILVGDKHIAYSDFKKMLFGENRPDKRWKFLHLLAAIYASSEQLKKKEIVPTSVENLAYSIYERIDDKAKMNVHTTKKSLASQLNQIFGMGYDDPFDDYNQWGYYKTKFTLIPEPELRRENPYEISGRFNENLSHTREEIDKDYDNEDDMN